MKKFLFCYANPATGHQQAAEAVMAALRRAGPDVEASAVRSVSYARPLLGRLISRAYLGILKHAPKLWDAIYDNPHIEAATRDGRALLGLSKAPLVRRLMAEHRPDAVVCTHAVPLNILAALKSRGKLRVPLAGIVTDYGVHSYWLSGAVDLYMVPTEEVRDKMVRAGIEPGRVRVTGIPVNPAFLSREDAGSWRARLGLDLRRPVVLVMGGSHGLGPMKQVVGALRRGPGAAQVIVVCGNNRRLLRDLQESFHGDTSVLLFGHTHLVPRLMDIADVLVSKPGGLTTSEALVKGLPMIIIKPIPGQEERNAAYLLRHRTGERARTTRELADAVGRLLGDRDSLNAMRDRCLALSRPQAAFDAAEHLLALAGDRRPTEAL